MQEFTNRKQTRFQSFDYNTACGYFITVCTEQRRPVLSRITVGADVLDGPQMADVLDGPQMKIELLEYGKIAKKYIHQFNDFYEDITIDQYVIMPDHIHFVMIVHSGPSRKRSGATAVNDMPGACQSRGVTEPQRDPMSQHAPAKGCGLTALRYAKCGGLS